MNTLQNILQEIDKYENTGMFMLCPGWIKKILEEHLSDKNINANDGWIPVEERLPEEHDSMFAKLKGTDRWSEAMFEKISDDVNVTVEYEDGTRKTTTTHTLDGKWKLPNRVTKQKVIAWQPLPDSYRKDGEL